LCGVSVWSYTDTGTVRTISDLKNAAAGLATVKASDEEEESWYSDEEDNAKPSVKPAPGKATKKQSSSDEEGGWYSDEDDAPATVTKRDLSKLPLKQPSPVKPKITPGKSAVMASPLRKAATKKLLSSGGSNSGSDSDFPEAEFVEGSNTVKVRGFALHDMRVCPNSSSSTRCATLRRRTSWASSSSPRCPLPLRSIVRFLHSRECSCYFSRRILITFLGYPGSGRSGD
jgi:hypothetical protein